MLSNVGDVLDICNCGHMSGDTYFSQSTCDLVIKGSDMSNIINQQVP